MVWIRHNFKLFKQGFCMSNTLSEQMRQVIFMQVLQSPLQSILLRAVLKVVTHPRSNKVQRCLISAIRAI